MIGLGNSRHLFDLSVAASLMAEFSRALGFLVAPFVEFSFLLTSCYTRTFVVLAF